MDLVRLSLIHQPLRKLETLQKLIRDKRFYQLRANQVNGTDTVFANVDEYVAYTTKRGELTATTPVFYATTRAAFLRDAETFGYYANLPDVKIDFWYCLTVDVPKITSICLDYLKSNQSHMIEINTLDTINWTEKIILTLLSLPARPFFRPVAAPDLRGFLFPEEIKTADDWRAFFGKIRRLVKPGEEYVYNQQVESVVSDYLTKVDEKAWVEVVTLSAYRYPLIGWIEIENLRPAIATLAYAKFLYEILEILAKKSYRFPNVVAIGTSKVTRNEVLRVRKIIANPDIVAMMNKNLLKAYWEIAGDISPYFHNYEVMNYGSNNYHPIPRSQRQSLQSLVLYQPSREAISDSESGEGELARRELFRVGADW